MPQNNWELWKAIFELLKWLGTVALTWAGIVMTVKHFAKETANKRFNYEKVIGDLAEMSKNMEALRLSIQENRFLIEQNKGEMQQQKNALEILQAAYDRLQNSYNTLLNDLINRYKTTRNR